MTASELIDRVKQLRLPGAVPDPTVRDALAGCEDVLVLADVGRLLEDVPADLLAAPGTQVSTPLRVALAATFTATNVAPLLRACLVAANIEPMLHLCPFDQLAAQLSDPDSELAAFGADVTLCLQHDGALLPRDWDPTDLPGLAAAVDSGLSRLGSAVSGYVARSSGAVVLHTVPLSPTVRRTVIGFDARAALGRLWRQANIELLSLAERTPSVHVLDLEAMLVDTAGPVRDERLYHYAGAAWRPTVELSFAREAANFCRALVRGSRKCLALDLDGTLWGGVVGDDGPAGIQLGPLYPGSCYTEVQRTARALRLQGVLLVACSRNAPEVVDEVLAQHPEMVLRREDFVAMAVGWHSKDRSLRGLAEELNLGLDAFVFADDSRFECDLIRHALPDVEVLRLAGDPAGHVTALLRGGHFDVLRTTGTDRERTELYRARLARRELAAAYSSATEYLQQLGLRVSVRRADAYALPRIVQLGQRTNQFTMIGRPHSEADTRRMAASPAHLVLGFEAADRLGGEGIVGGVWISRDTDHWVIENLVMSCRVFGRGVERAVLQSVVDRAVAAGVPRLEARFRRTGRNQPAEALYPDAGFTPIEESDGVVRYVLPLAPHPVIVPAWIALDADEQEAA
jgi:FkbH-like protein